MKEILERMTGNRKERMEMKGSFYMWCRYILLQKNHRTAEENVELRSSVETETAGLRDALDKSKKKADMSDSVGGMQNMQVGAQLAAELISSTHQLHSSAQLITSTGWLN